MRQLMRLLIGISLFLMASCATVGREFPVELVSRIEVGKTTQTEILNMFGPPWRKGIENGKVTWTYGYYRYTLTGTQTVDLYIKFNNEGVVESYNFSSN